MATSFFIMNKHVIFFGVVFSILIFTALPSFADSPNRLDFTFNSFPVSSDTTNDSNHFFINGFFINSDGAFYFEYYGHNWYWYYHNADVQFGEEFIPGVGVGRYFNSNGVPTPDSYLNFYWGNFNIPSSGRRQIVREWHVYNTSGQLVSGSSGTVSDDALPIYDNYFLNYPYGSTQHYLVSNNQIVLLTNPYPDYSLIDNVVYKNPTNNSTPSVVMYQNFSDDFSIDFDIYVNDNLVYSPSSNGNIATHIIANGVGALTPEYDANGNIINYSFNVTVDSDYSPIFDYHPEYDVPGLEFDYSSDMPNVEFSQNQLSELSVMDGGTALSWFYARLNDLGAGNVKILALITSCLSLGFVTLILNKRV